MSSRIRLSILSEAQYFRETITECLAREPEFEVLDGASSVHELSLQLQGRPVEVLLVHTNIESILGPDVVYELRSLLPATRVIVLGFLDSPMEITRWVESGASAYLRQDADYGSLRQAIHDAVQGRATCSFETLRHVVNRIRVLERFAAEQRTPPTEPLTDREREVARLLRDGLQNKAIAKQLNVRTSTIQTHVHSVLKKLNLQRRFDLLGGCGNMLDEG